MSSLPGPEGPLLLPFRTGSTLQRTADLRNLREELREKDLSPKQLEELVPLLFSTIPAYRDRASRREVQSLIHTTLARQPALLQAVTRLLKTESAKQGLASTNALVLAEWCSLALQFCAEDGAGGRWRQCGADLVQATAQTLALLAATATRDSVRKAGLVVTRRAFRRLFRGPEGSRVIEEVVTQLTSKGGSGGGGSLGQAGAVLLGVVAGVCARLDKQEKQSGDKANGVQPSASETLQKLSGNYYSFWSREVVGSKNPVPSYIANSLHDFFSGFATVDGIKNEIVPALEKALLRAPEVVLNDLITPIVSPLSQESDFSGILVGHLMKPLLSSIKSSNTNTRIGAERAFGLLLDRSTSEDAIRKVLTEVLDPLAASKITSTDQRAIYSRLLSHVSPSPASSSLITKKIASVATKEPNELALAAQVATLRLHLNFQLQSPSETAADDAINAFAKGLSDKKPAPQRIWALEAGALLYSLKSCSKLADAVLPKLLTIFKEVVANPIPSAQSGIVVVGYILVSLHENFDALKKAKVIKEALSASKPSFLLNHKAYSKSTAKEDFLWLSRALSACTHQIAELGPDSEVSDAWVQAFLFAICSSQASHDVVPESVKLLSLSQQQDPAISFAAVAGLWSWVRDVEAGNKDSAAYSASTGTGRLHLAVQAVCATASDQQILIEFLVLARPEVVPKISWIELCLKAGHDPGTLVAENPEKCLARIRSILSTAGTGAGAPLIEAAAYNTFAELAFVAPEAITPVLVEQFALDLDLSDTDQYGPTDFAIAKTPEGTTYVDVLAKRDADTLDKGASNYDTLKWEAEIRAQVAAKTGQKKKLTTDEQNRVNAQLAKEAGIREKVLVVERRLHRGIGVITALANGPPTDVDAWIGPALRGILFLVERGFGLLVGDRADKAYLACAGLVKSRLGAVNAYFLGVASLRAYGSNNLAPDLQAEPLASLVTRMLYRIRLSAEQRPFDNVALNYMIPLVSKVLKSHGVGEKGDVADEQVTLALEFLSFQTENFSSKNTPRKSILSIVIHSMQVYTQHYKLTKDCILDLCRALSTNIATDELAVLLEGAIVPQSSVRNALLQGIRADIDLTDLDFCTEVWLACHDDEEENRELAFAIWEENALEAEGSDAFKLLTYLESQDGQLRRSTARSIAECVSTNALVFEQVISQLEDMYREKAKPRVPERDAYGLIKKTDLRDPWEARNGIAITFREMAPSWKIQEIVPFIEFLVNSNALGDQNPSVRDDMISCAIAVISQHGSKKLEELMTMFENVLEASGRQGLSDSINEAVVILYGATAQHLKPKDPRLPKVINRLLETLSTPSETVQYAVAMCLPPLIRSSPDKVSDYVQQCLEETLKSSKFAERRGGAYGLAGIVKGRGVLALKEFRIMMSLKAAAENKKDANGRQGALFAFELLSLILGRTFEPYVIQLVPQLITSFGDANADVREACLDASKTCFSSLSSYGVKVILPTLLEGLGESQWRSKKGACELIGAMAYLDPQQLALSLPDIIPPLSNVLNDSHKEVRAAANRSLQRFGEVISNPEIKSLVGILLKALSDPTKYTDEALDALIKVSFVHYLDAPSLALVVRILERGLGDRSQTKRKAAQIIGSLAHLTERKDLVANLPILVEGLRGAIVDPVPSTRATSSKALGSLVEKLGEDALPDLIPSLMATLRSDDSAGDRLGSAQALSEVLAGLGTVRLEETLPTILQNASSSRPTVREGFMTLFIFLPACFGNSFANYLNKIVPPILSGLADDVESIRETSLRAGRLLVKNFATKSIDLLLPELDRGLADNSHRIRLSSVELVGDLLFNLTGISGKSEEQQEEDEETGAAEAGQSLLEVLGEEKRNKILSSLYICRCDTSGLVRSAAIAVWKALVATPRTLKELIPTLTQSIIKRLGSSNMEQKVIAGNALGELIRKAGEGVLSSLLPTLEEGLQTSTDTDNKQGICIALREIISAATRETIEDYEKTIVSVVRLALVDSDSEVRETAAEAFDSLQQMFGKRAVDQVLPYLLNLLRNESEADVALSALLTLLTDNTRSSVILPNLVPTLLTSPITAFNARAIASLAEVAGPAMSRRLSVVLNKLMDNIIACKEDDEENLKDELEASFDAVLNNLDENDGLNTAMSVMLTLVKNDDHRKRACACKHLGRFFASAEVDFSRYNQDLIRVLLLSFDDGDIEVVKAAAAALTGLMKRLRKEEMESLVPSTRQILQQVGVSGHDLPGFCIPKGINSILPIFLQGLMNGTVEQRIQSALSISDIISRTNPDGLKPFVTNITGPLIRVVSEKSVDLKSAILLTLNNLLEKIPQFLKPFLPQLQRTFAKSLADPNSEVLRSRAAKALGTLLTLKPRVDPLIAELVTGTKTEDAGVQNAMLKALYEVVSKAGESMSETSRNAILGLIDSDRADSQNSTIITHARLLGALIKTLPASEALPLTKQRVLPGKISYASILSLNSVLLESPDILQENFAEETVTTICNGITDKLPAISDNAVLASGKYLLQNSDSLDAESSKQIFSTLAAAIAPGQPADTRRLSLVVVRTVSRKHSAVTRPLIPVLIPPIFASLRDMVIPVKLAAEASFLSLFDVVESEGALFEKYINSPAAADLPTNSKRSMQDYFKRVALRLAGQARERKEAEGGAGGLGLSSDEREDEREIWSVGRVELGDIFKE